MKASVTNRHVVFSGPSKVARAHASLHGKNEEWLHCIKMTGLVFVAVLLVLLWDIEPCFSGMVFRYVLGQTDKVSSISCI